VSLGDLHTVVLMVDGSVRAFGDCRYGGCGSGSATSAYSDSSTVDLGGGKAKVGASSSLLLTLAEPVE